MFTRCCWKIAPSNARNVARKIKPAPLKTDAEQRHKDEKLMFGGVLELKKEKLKRAKRQNKVGLPLNSPGSASPDSESHWLESLSSKDIKVYRKTESGRYKAIDKNKLLDRMKVLLEEEENKVLEPPKIILSDTILKNLTSVPMLSPKKDLEFINSAVEISRYPAVTKILSESMSEEGKAALDRWKQKLIDDLGLDGFNKFNREQLATGAKFHACVRQHLEGERPTVQPEIEPMWHSVREVLQKITDVKLVEKNVAHSKLMYKGVVDCVASYHKEFKNGVLVHPKDLIPYRKVPSVIEWKVSQKQKPELAFTYDAPIQLTAYLGALSYDSENKTDLRNGLVVVAYKDGSPADVFPMDEQLCLKHWFLWLKRLQRFWQISGSKENTLM